MLNLKALKEAAEKAGGAEWDLVEANEHHGPYLVGPAGDVADFYTMTNPQSLSARNGGDSKPVLFIDAVENAAFAALANPSTILSLIERCEELEASVDRIHTKMTNAEMLPTWEANSAYGWCVDECRRLMASALSKADATS